MKNPGEASKKEVQAGVKIGVGYQIFVIANCLFAICTLL